MKQFIIVFITLLSLCGVARAEQPQLEQLWDRANTAYINADYAGALSCYDSIVATGHRGYKLYYNMGNAYFKSGQIGRSILYYNKALRLAPSDVDTNYNLSVANSFVKDKIERVPEFFVVGWMRAIRLALSSNTWAMVSLAALALALALVLFYLLSQKMALRKGGFFGAVLCIVMFVVTAGFSTVERREMIDPTQAIIMSSSAAVKSSPDNASKDLFVLHEGTKVKVVSSLDKWREVAIADGNKGWILGSSIQMIE